MASERECWAWRLLKLGLGQYREPLIVIIESLLDKCFLARSARLPGSLVGFRLSFAKRAGSSPMWSRCAPWPLISRGTRRPILPCTGILSPSTLRWRWATFHCGKPSKWRLSNVLHLFESVRYDRCDAAVSCGLHAILHVCRQRLRPAAW